MKAHLHKPSVAVLIWLLISVPIVLWDTLYVQLRPYTMPGGSLHSPVWTPYTIYARVDYVYGWPAWDNHLGFTAAQSAMNLPESVFYCWYLYVVLRQLADWSYEGLTRLEVRGKDVDLALLLVFSAAVMTVSKSILYWLNEAFSGFAGIGHNSVFDLIVYWIVPNGAWIVVPGYMIYVLGKDVLRSMSEADDEKKAK